MRIYILQVVLSRVAQIAICVYKTYPPERVFLLLHTHIIKRYPNRKRQYNCLIWPHPLINLYFNSTDY